MPPDHDAELVQLRAQLSAARASAHLHARRAEALVHDRIALLRSIEIMRASLFWRASFPARFIIDYLRDRGGRRAQLRMMAARNRELFRKQGFAGLRAKLRRLMKTSRLRETMAIAGNGGAPAAGDPVIPVPSSIVPNLVIIAELSVLQCAKYRVWQKQKLFAGHLGIPTRVVDWTDIVAARSAIITATMVIVYRVPGEPVVLQLIAHARRYGVPIWYDLDDLIFDRELYLQNRSHGALPADAREGVLSAAILYRTAMLACDGSIASTPALAKSMLAAGVRQTYVIENTLDDQTIEIANQILASKSFAPRADGTVVIGYGSGSRTHDGDFRQAAPALLRVLRARPQARLRIIGELQLPDLLNPVAGQIEALPPAGFARYLGMLAQCDISIAPLEPSPFNDAKSNIKFLEAACVGVASVCSPRAHFVDVVDRDCGRLAANDEEWEHALLELIDDAPLRERLARAALARVMDHYAPASIAEREVRGWLAPFLPKPAAGARKLRVLMVSTLFAPRELGPAAIVAEKQARALLAHGGCEVTVATGITATITDGHMIRYWHGNVPVFAIPLPSADSVLDFDNPLVSDHFSAIIAATKPDIVMIHSLNGLSGAITQSCDDAGVPYVMVLQDRWYACARGDMMRKDGKFCGQFAVDTNICASCVPHAQHLAMRANLLRMGLNGAARLLAPSVEQRDFYAANGVHPDKIKIFAPPVGLPARPRAPHVPGVIRFGYGGGGSAAKGYEILCDAFSKLEREDFELVVTANPDASPEPPVMIEDFGVRGGKQVRVIPAFTQDSIDEFFDGIDVLVYPSVAPEGFGHLAHEALARGVFVISTDCGAPAAAIQEDVNGWVISRDQGASSLRAAVLRALDRAPRFMNFKNDSPLEAPTLAQHADELYQILQATVEKASRRMAI